MILLALALAIGLLLATPASAGSAVLVDTARTLAENVLGPGQVRVLRAADDGAQLLIRWESPTFQRTNSGAENRELMYGEAVLTTNAILGALRQVARIRFTILADGRMVGTGDAVRGRGVVLQFASELGGGLYVPPEPNVDRKPSTGATAQEI